MKTPSEARAIRWRLVLLAAGGMLILGAGLKVAQHPIEYGVSTARVLVDTPRSLAGTARSGGDDTIVSRAVLLASLLASDELSGEIAHRAGLPSVELGVVDASVREPAI